MSGVTARLATLRYGTSVLSQRAHHVLTPTVAVCVVCYRWCDAGYARFQIPMVPKRDEPAATAPPVGLHANRIPQYAYRHRTDEPANA